MESKTPLQRLAEQQARIDQMRSYIPELVVQARLDGNSWAACGRALGISRSEAYRKYAAMSRPLENPGPPTAEP